MRNRKSIYIFLVCLFALCLILAAIIFAQNSNTLKVIFLDVGQGDAILIEQGNKQILIDGGPSGRIILEKLGKHIPFWDRNIEMIIATHPDADHITGLVDVIKNYKVGVVMETQVESDSQIFKKYQELIREKRIETVEARRGERINIDDAAAMEILNPGLGAALGPQNANDQSVVARLIFGNDSFLFTGDLPGELETVLLRENINLAAKVIKVAHHGSKYSTGDDFLSAVGPEEAVISVGKNNSYGHPAPEILEKLKNRGMKIFRTDEIGDVRFECQGALAGCAIIAN